MIGLPSSGANEPRPRQILLARCRTRERGIQRRDDENPSKFLVVRLRSKPDQVVLTLRRGVHPGTGDTVVRPFVAISGEQVLPQGLTQFLEPVAEVSDHGKVSGDGVLALRQVMDRDDRDDQDRDTNEDEEEGH